MYNTRIAPSPTGDMHIGTARTAYFNWLAARSTGGKFILRIDDTDMARNKPEYIDVILKTMAWLGLDYDQLVRQSDRFEVYRRVAEGWVERGWAERFHNAIMFKMKTRDGLPGSWSDEIVGKVPITKDDLNIIDKDVLIKSDGSPAYNFATVVDDRDMGINLVIRGTDHITNTSKQVVFFHVLGAEPPKFAHVGLIYSGGRPLSKRDGAASMLKYQEAGYDPDAVLNFLARLGWGPKVDDKTTKLLPKDKMLQMFLKEGKMRSQPASFDLAKLESFDRKYKAKKGVWRTAQKLME